MSKGYLLLLPDGTRYDNLDLDQIRQVLVDECGWSYTKVKSLVDRVVGEREVAAWVRYANKLCERAEDTIEEIRQASNGLDGEFKQWLLSKKSTSVRNGDSAVNSARPSSPKAVVAAGRKRARQP